MALTIISPICHRYLRKILRHIIDYLTGPIRIPVINWRLKVSKTLSHGLLPLLLLCIKKLKNQKLYKKYDRYVFPLVSCVACKRQQGRRYFFARACLWSHAAQR